MVGSPIMNISERQRLITNEFASLATWEDRYKHLIARGKKMGELPEEFKVEDLKVRGCQSQVWLHAVLNGDGQILFRADSDAMIVKGLASVLVEVYSGATPQEILDASPSFLKDLGFESHLSPSRANGLYAMLKQILFYATAYKALQARQ